MTSSGIGCWFSEGKGDISICYAPVSIWYCGSPPLEGPPLSEVVNDLKVHPSAMTASTVEFCYSRNDPNEAAGNSHCAHRVLDNATLRPREPCASLQSECNGMVRGRFSEWSVGLRGVELQWLTSRVIVRIETSRVIWRCIRRDRMTMQLFHLYLWLNARICRLCVKRSHGRLKRIACTC